ncbi:MAG: PAS domain-containing protein [Geobacteraceae bacterium]|nr:PAS domain-containing protein [Geobacteraceae bacterium]
MRKKKLGTKIKHRNISRLMRNNAGSVDTSEGYCSERSSNTLRGEHFKELYLPPKQIIQVLDEYGCLLSVNNCWLKTTCYNIDEVIGRWFGELLVSCDINLFMMYLHSAGRTDHNSSIVVRMLRDDGSIIFVSCNISIRHDDYGINRQFYCTLEDITNIILLDADLKNDDDHFHLSYATVRLD